VLLDRQVVQAFLDEQANDAVGVEDEVGAVCVLVADDTVSGEIMSAHMQVERLSRNIMAWNIREKRDQLRSLREDVDIGVRDLGRHSRGRLILVVFVLRTNALARRAAEALEVVVGVARHC